jgi:alpha-tubulin suppressor-like RCC1 family protein
MAATEAGVWGLQDVRDKQLASEWSYDGARELYSLGPGSYGATGQNLTAPQGAYSSPKQVGTDTNWKQADTSSNGAAGGTKTDGTMWIWGSNAGGRLGLNQKAPGAGPGFVPGISSPTQIPGTNWNQIAMNNNYTFASKTDGTIWGWGENYGRLGLNQPQSPGYNRSSPTQIGGDSDWGIAFNTATGTSYAVKTSGELYAWGDNSYGEQALNDRTNRSSPKQVGTDTTWSTNINHWGPSDGHSMFAIKTDGTLWTWGYEDNGSLGLNNKGVSQSSPCQIPGTYTTVGATGMGASAVKSDGTIWAWGRNQDGQLGQGGLGLSSSRSSPVQMGTDTDWQTVAKGGQRQTGCVKTDGTYYNCGRGDTGSLGHDNTSDQATMTQVPGTYTTNYRQVQLNNAFLIKEV